MNKKIHIITFLTALLILSVNPVFSQKKSKKDKGAATSPTTSTASVSTDKRIYLEGIFMEGVQARILGNDEDAILKFKEVLKADPKNAAACYELTRVYFESQNFDEAEKYAILALKQDPTNEWYYIYLAETKAKMGDFEGASKVYENLTKAKPNDFEYYYDWAYMLAQQNQLAKALEVYSTLEKKLGKVDPDLVFQKVTMLLSMNKLDEATIEIRKLIKDDPKEFNYYGMLAEIYTEKQDYDDALQAYEDLLKLDPENTEAIIASAKLYKIKGDKTRYNEIVKQLFGNKSLDIDTKILAFIPFIEDLAGDSTLGAETLEMADLIIANHPNDAKALTARADVLFNMNKKEDAKAAYIQATETGDCPANVYYQLMILLSQMNDNKTLMEQGKKGMEKFPEDALIKFYFSLGAVQEKDYNAAVEALEAAVKLKIRNPELLTQMLTSLGDAYSELKLYDKSDDAYERALEIDPNNPTVLNNYAYFLSVRGEKLDRAEKMSARSNILEPNNAAFQDTYAWIMFQQGKYKDAKLWMEKALAQGNNSDRPVLLEHYGDILYKLNDIEKAVQYWKKALDAGGEKNLLQQKIEKKQIP